MKKTTILANKANYGTSRPKTNIKYAAVHFTANDGDTAKANGKYFQNALQKPASAHAFVDDEFYVESVPEDHVAYSVGGSKYNDCNKTGGGKLYGVATNSNTINLELCDTNKNGVLMATDKTLTNAYTIIAKWMKEYNIDIDHVIRHFDVTGKYCPVYYMDNAAWDGFKANVMKVYNGEVPMEPIEDEVEENNTTTPAKKSVDEVAREVIKGAWGSGAERKQKLEAAGYSYAEVQAKVNTLLNVNKQPEVVKPAETAPVTPAKKSVDEIAREVIKGAWGSGAERKQKLEAAGYDYAVIQNYVNMLLGKNTTTETKVEKPATPTKKSVEEIAKEVIKGAWGSGAERKQKLEAAGYDYNSVQIMVNSILGSNTAKVETPAQPVTPTPAPVKPAKKSVDEIANEVIKGSWGSGTERKQKLEAAGYNYAEVQAKVNALLKGSSASSAPAKKSVDEIAKEVIKGSWGSGAERKQKLEAAGYSYAEVQAKVNALLK